MLTDLSLSKTVKTAIILFFMLFAMDFLGIGWYLLGVAFVLTIFYLLLTHYNPKLDHLFLAVALLAVVNFLIMFHHSNASLVVKVMKYLMSPLFSYAIGTVLASRRKENDSIIKLYMIAVIPYFIHGVLNMLIFDGFSDFNRELADFWTGEMWKATLVCTYFAMTVPLVFLSFLTKSRIKRIAYFLLTAYSVYACIATASRTVIVIGVVVLLMLFLLHLKSMKSAEKYIATLLKFALVIGVVIVVISLNMDALSSSDFFRRMFKSDLSEEPRIQLFKNIIFNAWDYPFGNMPFFYSHNTWLDFLRESGWFTFAIFCFITVILIKDLVVIFKSKTLSAEQRYGTIAMMTALLLDMFVEPILDGAAILFSLFFYFISINRQFAKEEIGRKKDVKITK